MINLSWSGYKQIKEEDNKKLPTYAGVYKLSLYNLATYKYEPFYVGQAINIYERTIQHAGSNEENSGIKNRFKNYAVYTNYAEVKFQSERDAIEVALYNHYKTDCNDPKALPNVIPAIVNSFN